MGIGNKIKEARERMGLTQIELGEKLGITGSAVTNYENNVSHPKEPILYKLFEVLEVDPNYLFQDEVSIKDKSGVLKINEKALLKKYNNLNTSGQTKVDEYIDDLSGNPEYLKEKTYPVAPAAFGGASKTGKVTKSNLNKFNDVLENPME